MREPWSRTGDTGEEGLRDSEHPPTSTMIGPVKMQASRDFSTFFDLAFLAMAQARSGHPEEANRQLALAKKVLEKVAAPDAKPAPWHVRVAVDRVRKEAESLVQPAKAASKPTTP
jgi:hypothetical protein